MPSQGKGGRERELATDLWKHVLVDEMHSAFLRRRAPALAVFHEAAVLLFSVSD